MSRKKIDHPKVFISYAWGTEEYQEKVLSFATQLMSDGIEVVLDKWDLTEGNDTYAFMEKCANDETITNVLMLIDPIYAEKANAHTGGVGTETQIISAKVYQEVAQVKFIPIVFARNENNEVCKPTYLQGRLHFDLSLEENYDNEYLRLVKTLYGEEIYKKPELGVKPAWVENSTVIEVKKKNTYESLKNVQPEKAKRELFRRYLEELFNQIKENINSRPQIAIDYKEAFDIYGGLLKIRSNYILLLDASIYVDGVEKIITKELEGLNIWADRDQNIATNLVKVFIHELFLYTVAYFLKSEEYSIVGYILRRTYYNAKSYRAENEMSGYNVFYSGREELLDRAMKDRDQKNYYSGTAAYWIENIDVSHFSKEQIVLADLICFNVSVYGKDCLLEYPWFPMTYVYDNQYGSVLGTFAKRMVSKEFVESVIAIFGYETINDFVGKFKKVSEDCKNGEYRNYRYTEAWDSASMLNMFITADKIATYR